jgi:hypothetical protein
MTSIRTDNVAAIEQRIVRAIREWRELYALTDAMLQRSSSQPKTKAQRDRELAKIDGLCEGAYRFTGRDLTPISLRLRMLALADKAGPLSAPRLSRGWELSQAAQ